MYVLQVYYHLGDYEDSLHYALGADHLFDVSDTSEYVETTIGAFSLETASEIIRIVQYMLIIFVRRQYTVDHIPIYFLQQFCIQLVSEFFVALQL